ncbi:hypothetical protein WN943_005210 [Citrus x changshan-huyou]
MANLSTVFGSNPWAMEKLVVQNNIEDRRRMQEEHEAPAAKRVYRSGSVSITLADSDVLDCPICFGPFRPPVYQCENGHIVTDRNRDTQIMRLYASVDVGCADCWRRASGMCVCGIQRPRLFGVQAGRPG